MKRVIKRTSRRIFSASELSDFKIVLDGRLLYRYLGSDEHVIVPEGVVRIGPDAFADCTTLRSIVLPDGLRFISKHAFENCHSLTSINIPDSVEEIETAAFFKCNSLSSIDIPDSVTVRPAAFKGTPLDGMIEETSRQPGNYVSNNINDEDDVIEDGDMPFDEWYESDEFDQAMDIFEERVESMLKQSNTNVAHVWDEPSIQGYQGLDSWFITVNGNEISVDFDWYDEISAVYEDGPEAAAEQYAQQILAQLPA